MVLITQFNLHQDLRSSSLAAKEPYHIPGYAGHKPQYNFQCGDTFGKTTNKLLTSTKVSRSPISILQPITQRKVSTAPETADSNSKNIVNLLNRRYLEQFSDKVFKPQMRSGYSGHVPGASFSIYHGKNFPNICDQALSVFSTMQIQNRKKLEKTRQITTLSTPRQPKTEQLNRYPFQVIRSQNYSTEKTTSKQQSANSISSGDKQKYFISGYSGHIPFYKDVGGRSFVPVTNSALNIFANQQEHNRTVKAMPITQKSIKEQKIITDYNLQSKKEKSSKIYETNKGLIPSYSGYVPGEKFRHGNRFTVSTSYVQTHLLNTSCY